MIQLSSLSEWSLFFTEFSIPLIVIPSLTIWGSKSFYKTLLFRCLFFLFFAAHLVRHFLHPSSFPPNIFLLWGSSIAITVYGTQEVPCIFMKMRYLIGSSHMCSFLITLTAQYSSSPPWQPIFSRHHCSSLRLWEMRLHL